MNALKSVARTQRVNPQATELADLYLKLCFATELKVGENYLHSFKLRPKHLQILMFKHTFHSHVWSVIIV